MKKLFFGKTNFVIILLCFAIFSCKKDEETKLNESPTIQINSPQDQADFNLGEVITFKATANDAEDGALTNITWNSDKDGQIGTGSEISVSNLTENTHIITATVEDSKGISVTASVTIFVSVPNTAPQISLVETPIAKTYQNRSFSASVTATDVEDGNLTTITWVSDKDGEIGTGTTVTFSDLSPATHQITATTTDSKGLSAEVSFNVEVLAINPELFKLANWMVGSFSSQNQADSSSDVYHVDVRVQLVQIWDERTDGYWLYIEQAYADDLGSPYRKRIYHLFEQNGVLKDLIYELPRGLNFNGQWANPDFFDVATPADLTEKVGCGLDFEFIEDKNWFFTETIGKDCTASIPGVAYLKTTATIAEDHFTSWDLGYNSSDVIVLGPYSPYYFDKIETYTVK
ncbi:CpcT/CpeT family chromophore lyase [Bernardetia sp. OM2101]|uniref:chromophore lyase CpcT/CpeT n=1 Tax=Bernardetia sp. OM2101 TaxID=3344876 RepID=UPI0035D0488E